MCQVQFAPSHNPNPAFLSARWRREGAVTKTCSTSGSSGACSPQLPRLHLWYSPGGPFFLDSFPRLGPTDDPMLCCPAAAAWTLGLTNWSSGWMG